MMAKDSFIEYKMDVQRIFSMDGKIESDEEFSQSNQNIRKAFETCLPQAQYVTLSLNLCFLNASKKKHIDTYQVEV